MIGNGSVTKLNGRTVRARETSLKEAVVVGSDFDNIRKYQPQANWNSLTESVAHTRTWGDGYGYMLVASGRAQVMIDPILNPWDLIPVLPILKGAGVTITDWQVVML
jgi:myo-inositol-1(or 4)-monophosphatase